jgi:hypothetical protein
MADSVENSETPPQPIRVGRLDTLHKVRRELARLYRDLRNDRVTSRVAGSGAYILTAICKALESEAIETRLAALEERAAGLSPTRPQQAPYARH